MSQATRDLPTGMVTFVFTDIEGSTRLLSRLGDAYTKVLARHHALLRRHWEEHHGREVSTEGDQFLVAFRSTEDAARACIGVQRSLSAEVWPHSMRLRVRAGIHRGLASPQGENYVALAVHQAKRVVDTAHGGQIVVSQDAAEAVSPESGLGLRPLGRYRVRDFPEPIRLYQLLAEGLEDHFPAVRALPADAHNILRPATSIVGRKEDVTAVSALVTAGGTVTLVGPGGVGKSRLAAEVGITIAPQWEDGVWFVDLSAVEAADLVPGTVATAIGARTDPTDVRTNDVLRHLETRRAVIILDNCEQVAAACRELISAIRSRCERVAVVATSREPLRAPGERLWPVAPLGFPTGPTPSAAAVLASPSGRLFWERGIAVSPGFAITESNAAAVAEICRHLDGLPLLIELAAAHLPHQSPQEILSGLEDGFRLLSSRDPRLPPRHRTVEALLSWSYRLLRPSEQATLRRLAVFGGSFSRDGGVVAAADGTLSPDEIPELLWALLDRSLLTPDLAAGATRYRLLDSVHRFAQRLLDEQHEVEATVRRVSEWYLGRIGPWLTQDRAWISEVALEIDNLRALVSSTPRTGMEAAQQLACTIGLYHDAVQTYRDGVDELARLTDRLPAPTPARVSLLTTLSYLCARTGQVDRAAATVGEAESLRRAHGAPPWDEVGVERVLGDIARRSGDLSGAVHIAQEALKRHLGEHGEARMQNLLGISAAALGDFATAYEACRRELELNKALGRDMFVASAHGNLAEVAFRLGDIPAAARHQRSSLDLALAQGSPAMVAFSLMVAARIAARGDDWRMAVSLQARAERMLTEIGLVMYPDDQQQVEVLMTEARHSLGDTAFDASIRTGQATELPDAVDLARNVLKAAAAEAKA